MSDVRIKLETSVCRNHAIFSSVENVPDCLWLEIYQELIMPKIEHVLGTIKYEVMYDQQHQQQYITP